MEIYKNLLIEKLKWASNQKIIIYNHAVPARITCNGKKQKPSEGWHDQLMCFNFFKEFNLYQKSLSTVDHDEDYEYIPEQKFNYYLLIKESFYKSFKKLNLTIATHFICYNDCVTRHNYFKIFPDVSKFTKDYYNKKRMNFNGINYIRLKLRAFKNTFIPNFCLEFDTTEHDLSKRRIEYVMAQINFLSCITSEDNNVKLMAIPIKKIYSKRVILNFYRNYNAKITNELRLTDKLILKGSRLDIVEDIINENKKYYDPKIYYEDYIKILLYNEETEKSIILDFIYFFRYENDD